MNIQSLARIALPLLLTVGTAAHLQQRAAPTAPAKSGTLPVNGIDYYYEIHGTGEPLLLLHGGLMSSDMFGPVLATLGAGREVIAVDAHGHGRTSLAGKHIDFVAQADDMAALVARLGHK